MRSREPTLQELQPGLRIDRDDLDSEIAMQADTFYRVAEASALAASRRDEAKSATDEELSRAAGRVRADAAARDEKPTESYIKEQSGKDRKYLDARNVYLKAKLEADLWSAMREAYDMRAKMLGKEAELQIAGYYQVASVGGRRQRQIGEITNESNRAALRRASKDRG